MIDATQIRKGMVIIKDGQLFRVMEMQLITPGRWKAMVQTKLRNIRDGSQTEHRFRSEERLEQAYLEEVEMEFLYQQGDDFVLMNLVNYEQITLRAEAIGDGVKYLLPNTVIKVEMLKSEGRNYAKTFSLELYACEFCELCVQVCPTDAIIMMKSFDMATADRREMLLDKDRLHAIGLQYQPSWATGNRLRDMQAPPKKEKPEAHGQPGGGT